MYYYTYLIIPINKNSKLFGKVYFGQHRTNNLDDGYKASGKQITRYLKKYPNDYYREIIKFYSSEEELNKAEFDLIHPHLNKGYCLNLCEGGSYGALSEEAKKRANKNNRKPRGPKQCENIRNGWYKSDIESRIKKQVKSLKKYYEDPVNREKCSERTKLLWQDPEYRKKTCASHTRIITTEELEKRSESLKGKNKGKHKVWDNKELNIYHMEY